MESLFQQSGRRSECERLWSVDTHLRQWVKTEHYRLHSAEDWPDSPYKEAVLAAARSALQRLESAAIGPFDSGCVVCATRRAQAGRVLMFPSRPNGSSVILKPAA